LPPRPAVYYRQHGILVTSQHFAARGYRYDLHDLTDLAQAKGSQHPGLTIGLVIAAAEAVLMAPLVGVVRSPLAWTAAVVVLLVPCLVGLVCAWRWPPVLELQANYRGRRIALFNTRNELDFHQVIRALQRATEAHRGRWPD
jgi:hypothetical protein